MTDTDEVELDVSGLVCPQPVLVVRRCLAELETGAELVVTGDDPPAQRSIQRTCHKHGYAVATESHPDAADGTFTLRIRVTADATRAATAAPDSDEHPR